MSEARPSVARPPTAYEVREFRNLHQLGLYEAKCILFKRYIIASLRQQHCDATDPQLKRLLSLLLEVELEPIRVHGELKAPQERA